MKNNNLMRSMTSRQMEMIGIGGSIGVGLFMGSFATIKWTGPSVILAYMLAGLVLFAVMRALGEMVYINPTTGSFADYAAMYLHPIFGYITKWSNVFQYIIVGMSEVIAMTQYLNYWWPNLPALISGTVAIMTLTFVNLVSAKAYGTLEFYFSLVKVVTIVLMIIIGFFLIFIGKNHEQAIGLSNLWKHGGFFTGGFKGFMFSLSIVIGSYQAIELLGIAAGEADNPQISIVRAVKTIVWRIIIFYVGSIFIIVTIYPWNQLQNTGSPFVEIFRKIGIPSAAGIINFVIITAALSGANSAMYSSSRMLFKLFVDEEIPRIFRKLSKHLVPNVAVLSISLGILFGFLLNTIVTIFNKDAESLFVMVYSSSVLPGMVPWFVILLSELKFRKQKQDTLNNHPFKMPFFPVFNYFAITMLVIILIFMFINPMTRVPVLIGSSFLMILVFSYFIVKL